jgi:hypothetical protein
MDELASRLILAHITNVTIEMHEYVLPSVTKKKVAAASVSSTKAKFKPKLKPKSKLNSNQN